MATPNVIRVLRTRDDMIAHLTSNAAKPLVTASLSEHHNYASRIITCPIRAIIVLRAQLSISASLIPGCSGCGSGKSADGEKYYKNTSEDNRSLEKGHSVRNGDLNLAELLIATARAVGVENEGVGILLEHRIVTESGALIGEGVGCATAVITRRGLGTILQAGCVAVGGILGEGVHECGNGVLLYGNRATYLTMLTLGKTGGVAGGLNSGIDNEGVGDLI